MLCKKRGMGTQVSMVLSFVIFITFIVFLYSSLIAPNVNQSGKQFLIESTKIKLIEYSSDNLTLISIKTEPAEENCIRITNFLGNFGIDNRIIVINGKTGNSVSSYVIGSDLEISRNDNSTFFKVYNSPNFSAASSSEEDPCPTKGYDKGLVKKEEYLFEKKIISLINDYNSNYTKAKDDFGIPGSDNFGFGFVYNNGTVVETERETFGNVYSAVFPVQYVSEESIIKIGNVKVSVW